ncbi:hypothetical protein KO481_34775 [Nocardia sp. NEAU-G5]|uniref:Group II intron maturase-specific domain-containing protein n=1 Tax=Nocardia albiluteola TaxID=2842303 RepID=A0ABS6B8S6_9NOCA|nr:hypothetical protein [Nocardia albiluteola]MBU3066669.1 hypothetical protein [Nocardia albiluteola]
MSMPLVVVVSIIDVIFTARPSTVESNWKSNAHTTFGASASTGGTDEAPGLLAWRVFAHLQALLTPQPMHHSSGSPRGPRRTAAPPTPAGTRAFYRSKLYVLCRRINTYLMRWVRRKYKRLRGFKKRRAWWHAMNEHCPRTFAHWEWTRSYLPTEW